MNKALISIFYLTLIGCGEVKPEYVYVPGPAFKETITARASATQVKTGQPVILSASRNVSGYIKVKYTDIPEITTPWWTSEPPAFEESVADNVRWVAAPPEGVKFNINFRSNRTREVTFSKAGQYRLIGYSGRGGREVPGNVIEIEVVD